MENSKDAFATLATEITVKRSHLSFLHAAMTDAGWEVDDDFEGVTTDEGYDHEVKMRLKISLPLEAIASAPDLGMDEDGIERLIADMKLIA